MTEGDSQLLSSDQRPQKIARVDDDKARDHDDCSEEIEEENSGSVENPRMQRYLVAIEYIGTRFAGAQQQLNRRTAIGALEAAFHKFIGKPVSVFCSSRTDTGVHALANVCHVDVERISKRKPGLVLPPHEPEVVLKAVNHFLQKHEGDISVIDVQFVPADFHARYRALERTYFYRLLSGPDHVSIFAKERAWHVTEELDLLAMQRACKILVGDHDFSSFRGSGCQAKSAIRSLDELSVTEVVSTPYFPSIFEKNQRNSEFGLRKAHRCIVVTARARSFLYHQVRLIVGVLKAVGTGEINDSDVERILEAKTVAACSPMAPACGLYLAHVRYDLP